jgi:hypothetical protein
MAQKHEQSLGYWFSWEIKEAFTAQAIAVTNRLLGLRKTKRS